MAGVLRVWGWEPCAWGDDSGMVPVTNGGRIPPNANRRQEEGKLYMTDRVKGLLAGLLVLIVVVWYLGWGRLGRYQLVEVDGMALRIDTVTGKTWLSDYGDGWRYIRRDPLQSPWFPRDSPSGDTGSPSGDTGSPSGATNHLGFTN